MLKLTQNHVYMITQREKHPLCLSGVGLLPVDVPVSTPGVLSGVFPTGLLSDSHLSYDLLETLL